MTSFMLAASDPIQHVLSHPIITLEDGTVVLDNHILMQVCATFLAIFIIASAFRSRMRTSTDDVESMVPRGMSNMFEALCSYLRDNVARPSLAEHTDRFIPYIWSAFFFVLFCNLLGLVPVDAILALFGIKAHIGGTATGNLWVTASLALCTLAMMVINGLRLGGMHFIAHFCPGPLWMAPLLVPVEIIGLFAKIFALTVRLFANMVAGHVLLAVLLGFVTSFSLSGVMVAIPAIAGAMAITALEIFVAFLQAYIFTFLTCLFIGQCVVFHHDDHGHEGAHEAAH